MKFNLLKFNFLVKIDKNIKDGTVEVQLSVYEEDKQNRPEGYFLKFTTSKEWNIFLSKICAESSPLLGRDETSSSMDNISASSIKTTGSSTFYNHSQVTELTKLIVYCQGVKLKEHNINKPQDLGKLIDLYCPKNEVLFSCFSGSILI